ncbi:MFS general substrate transporter [Macroventuria anomochaeta]|uniref:MFS general substrate transporter n=1 Tax=Macroventuria anomochaeta TaxID=301207 RepID=A0ACB6SCX7_9PLEO|nr:MFS general substrate transporter [Macroventuria anomochaeta]KAF2632135.1 MFS general substrate transporter [Macroventuria anomochaeta]
MTFDLITKEADHQVVGETQMSERSPLGLGTFSGLKLWTLSFGLCLITFVIALDNTIIATATPKITSVSNSLEDVGWYGSSYSTKTKPSFGKMYTYFDVKYTYLIALVIFEVGSVICAAGTSSPMFIIGRAIAGAGAAALYEGATPSYSGDMTIIGFSAPLREFAIYIAALSFIFNIASVVRPILGGAFTDRWSWRWCFWINLLFGGISLTVYSHIPIKERLKNIDLAGVVFLICAIVSLLLALQWGGFTYTWSNSKTRGTLLGFGLIITVFIAIQFYQRDKATIPERVFKQRTILFQAIKGTTAEESGIRTIAYLVSITVSSIVIGAAITVVGWYVLFMWFGSAVFAIGAGMLYTLEILAGVGAGAGVQIPFIAVQVVSSVKDMPTANACVLFSNSLGGALSVFIAQDIFVNTLGKEIPKYSNFDSQVVAQVGATNLGKLVPPEQLSGVLYGYNNAIVTAFVLAIATSCMAFLVSLGQKQKSVKEKKLMHGGGGA